MSNFIYKLKNLWYYYWGTEDGKYIVDHEQRQIVFLDKSFGYLIKISQSGYIKNYDKTRPNRNKRP